MNEMILGLVIANWDTIAAVIVLGLGLLLTWLKKEAAEQGLGVVVNAIENQSKSPPVVGKVTDVPIAETKARLIKDAMSILKARIKDHSRYTAAGAAIEKAVRRVDPK